VVINKLDLPETRKKFPALERLFARRGLHLLGLSAATGEGIAGLNAALWKALEQARAAAKGASSDSTPQRGIARSPTI
jgi:50S ribosomal subunit-associated GTPase HflX